MKSIIFSTFLFFSFSLSAQEKGVSPLSERSPLDKTQNSSLETSSTYAVVIGISDYQDEGIPDLRFADKDAEAFANFLRSPAGGSLDEDHLKMLTNNKATGAQIAITLDWLIDVVKEGETVIIYFSGHGDVESKRISQPGYLLGWDAPSSVYGAGGALNIRDLQDIVSTLSVYNKAKVIVVTDACRAGKLSGSDIDGAQITGTNLAKQYENEIKILSCQPSEYSIEGEQWGEGRGAFSYHLVNGLYGMADTDGDLSVTLLEIGRYLEDRVSKEVAPHSQLPMTVGNGRQTLANVDLAILKKVSEQKTRTTPVFAGTVTKGIEEEVLSLVDSITRTKYLAFSKALEKRAFFQPETACAEFYFNQLIGDPLLAKLHAGMQRNYAAALQDDAQQVINKMLISDDATCFAANSMRVRKYKDFPKYLKRAIELLGKDHYMYPRLQARLHWFEGHLIELKAELQNSGYDPEKQIDLYKKALSFQPDMPLAMVQLGHTYSYHLGELDTAEYYFKKALSISPNWKYALDNFAAFYMFSKNDLEKSKAIFEQLIELDSNSAISHKGMADWYMYKGDLINAEKHYLKSLEIFPSACVYCTLGVIYKNQSRYKEAEKYFVDGIAFDPYYMNFYNNLIGNAFLAGGEKVLEKATSAVEKLLETDSLSFLNLNWAGYIYMNSDFEKAEAAFRKIKSDAFGEYFGLCGLGLLYTQTGRFKEAEGYFQNAIALKPNGVRADVGLFMLYVIRGDEEQAKQQMQKVLAIDYREAITLILRNCKVINWGDSTKPIFKNISKYFKLLHELAPDNALVNFEHARLQAYQEDVQGAFENIEIVIKAGITDYSSLQKSDDFINLRNHSEQWDALMKKYFPDQFND